MVAVYLRANTLAKKWRMVTPSPRSTSGRKALTARPSGRATVLTLIGMASPDKQENARGSDHVQDRGGQKAQPTQLQQLIGSEARQRPPDHELQPAEECDLAEPGAKLDQDHQPVRQARLRGVPERQIPAAEKAGGQNRRRE